MAQLPAQQRDQLAGNPQPRELILAEHRAQRLDVSHVLSELEDLADDVIFLLDGSVEFQSSLRRLKEITGESRLEHAVACLMQRKAS
jgi:Cu-processing system ATP-binding protein